MSPGDLTVHGGHPFTRWCRHPASGISRLRPVPRAEFIVSASPAGDRPHTSARVPGMYPRQPGPAHSIPDKAGAGDGPRLRSHPHLRRARRAELAPGQPPAVLRTAPRQTSSPPPAQRQHPGDLRGLLGGPALGALHHRGQPPPQRRRGLLHPARLRCQGTRGLRREGRPGRRARRGDRGAPGLRRGRRRPRRLRGGGPGGGRGSRAGHPEQPHGDDLLYSSGTTGRPKGIKLPLPDYAVDQPGYRYIPIFGGLYGFDEGTVYLSPAPVYHAAPLRFGGVIHSTGGTPW